jgi:hypothetical protein
LADDHDVNMYKDMIFLGCFAAAVVNHDVAESRKRRKSIHSIRKYRDKRGDFRNLVSELRTGHSFFEWFNRYFRMTMIQFDELLALTGPELRLKNARYSEIALILETISNSSWVRTLLH